MWWEHSLVRAGGSSVGEVYLCNMYKMYNLSTVSVTPSQFRQEQSVWLARAQREPVFLMSRGVGKRAVVVSPDFYERAVETLELQEDIEDAARARQEDGRIDHE